MRGRTRRVERNSLRISIGRLAEVRLGRNPFDLLQVPVVLLVILGVLLAFRGASDLEQELARAKAAPVVETGDLAAADPGTDVVLSGRLGTPEAGSATYGLVVYERQRWECEQQKDGSYKGAWHWSADVSPPSITLDGREIAITLDRPTHMSGARFSSPTVMWGDGLWCDGRWEESIRYVGYLHGDAMCIFGRRGPGARLEVERLHGGGCASFLSYLARIDRGARTAGWIFLGTACPTGGGGSGCRSKPSCGALSKPAFLAHPMGARHQSRGGRAGPERI